jgi:hypothetical protein
MIDYQWKGPLRHSYKVIFGCYTIIVLGVFLAATFLRESEDEIYTTYIR